MTEKIELAGYLTNLLSIMESKEDAGIHRGPTLVKEYSKGYDRLRQILQKEHDEDEARNRKDVLGNGDQGSSKGRISQGRIEDGSVTSPEPADDWDN